jgi:hypothetical protein
MKALGQGTLHSGVFDVAIGQTGSFNVSVNGRHWFESGDIFYSDSGERLSWSKGNISVLSSTRDEGRDSAGAFRRVTLGWGRTSGGSGVEWRTSFLAYQQRSALVFRQEFVKAISKGVSGSRFPSLRAAPGVRGQLGTLEYTGSSCGFMVAARGDFPAVAGGSDNGMIAIVPSAVCRQSTTLTDARMAHEPLRPKLQGRLSILSRPLRRTL